MRIIAGEARGRALCAPRGMETRPTADRVREALFNILSARVRGARVLDAFSGSGAMALEALSRGAEYALMCDISRPAYQCMERNVKACGFEGRARLFQGDWKRALAAEKTPFDLIILDPPYRMTGAYAQVLSALRGAGLVAPDAVAVLECAREAEIDPGEGFEIYDRRAYGAAQVLLCRPGEENV